MKTDFTIGDLACFDSFSGLIPCKVIAVQDSNKANPEFAGRTLGCEVTAVLTAPRKAYRKGETIKGTALNIIPRPFIRRRNHSVVVVGGYRWIA